MVDTAYTNQYTQVNVLAAAAFSDYHPTLVTPKATFTDILVIPFRSESVVIATLCVNIW